MRLRNRFEYAIAAGLVLLATSMLDAPSAFAQGDGALSLSQAMELARRRAPEIRAAKAAERLQAAETATARAGYYPALTAQATGDGTSVEGAQPLPPPGHGVFGYATNSLYGEASVNVHWLIYDFGHTGGAVDEHIALEKSATANVEATEHAIALNSATAYLTVVFAEKLRDVTQATVAQRERLATLARGLVHSGLQPPLEEIRALARTEQARVDLATAIAAVDDARCALAVMLGIDPMAPLRVTAPRLAPVSMTPQAAMRDTTHLPTIVAADATVDAYRASAASARAQYLPTISLQANGAYGATQYDTESELITLRTGTAGVVFSVPIFDAAISASVAAANANAENAKAGADLARRTANDAAARAAVAESSARAILERARKSTESAAGVLTIVQARYSQGLASPLELIEAENEDSVARVAETRAEQEHALATVRLLVATGRKVEER